MTEVCGNVEIEPTLQPLFGEAYQNRTANKEDNAQQGIRAHGFWGGEKESAFFGIRVFNPYVPSNNTRSRAANYTEGMRERARGHMKDISLKLSMAPSHP